MGQHTYCDLHAHSYYSLLDGFNDPAELIQKCIKQGSPAVAITDHGNMFGSFKFANEAKKQGIKPIIGMEAYIAAGSRLDKTKENGKNHHQVMWCKNQTGLQNMFKLSSLAYSEGFYGKPRIDMELLEKYREGIIVTSSCLAGLSPQAILNDDYKLAERHLSVFKDMFGDDFYLEVQFNGLDEQNKVNEFMRKMHKQLNIEMVTTSDAHYLNEEDWETHELVLAMQTGSTIKDEKRFKFPAHTFYIHTPEEMEKLSAQYPGAYENTYKIAEKCDVTLESNGWVFPDVDGYSDESFIEKCTEALKAKLATRGYEDKDKPAIWKEYKARLDEELSVIVPQGYGKYFAVVEDYCRWSKEQGILMSPARGSAGGCLVSYVLKISDVDPVEYGLYFERFLNKERVSPPDIDSDFQDDRREEVIQYCRDTYGDECVAHVAKFGTVGVRAAIRRVSKALGYDFGMGKEFVAILAPLAKIVEKHGHSMTIDEILAHEDTMKAINRKKEFKHIFKYAKRIAGMNMVENAGVNASGLIITDKPIRDYVPTFTPPKTKADGSAIPCTQFDKIDVEEMGLIKFDILGLKTLSAIDRTLALVKERHGIDLPRCAEEYDLTDQEVYKASHEWETLSGCFQVETSDGFKKLFKDLKPTNIQDISDILALWRPGPIQTGLPDEFIEYKKTGGKREYAHESMGAFMDQTAGLPIYQEQIMKTAQVLAGYSLAEADLLRRAIGKKDMEKMDALKDGFVEKCVEVGLIDQAKAEETFEDFRYYGDYCFNLAHSVAYAFNTYWTMWLRHYYPVEFFVSCMNVYLKDEDIKKKPVVSKYIRAAKRTGYVVKVPDFRYSRYECTIEDDNTIRLGFGCIKGVGAAVDDFIDYYGDINGDLEDFNKIHVSSVGRKGMLGKKNMEALIFAGAFDYLDVTRDLLFGSYNFYEEKAVKKKVNKDYKMRLSMMETGGIITPYLFKEMLQGEKQKRIDKPDFKGKVIFESFNQDQLQDMCLKFIPCYPVGTKLEKFEFIYKMFNLDKISDFLTGKLKYSRAAGVVSEVREFKTKKGSWMAVVTIEDAFGAVLDVTMFPSQWKDHKSLCKVGTGVCMEGEKQDKNDYNDNITMIAKDVKLLRNFILNKK